MKWLPKIWFILILLLVLHTSFSGGAKYDGQTWGEIKDKPHTFVFKLDLKPFVYRESLSLDEFVIHDKISQINFKVLNFPSNVSSISFKIKITSPTGRKVYESSEMNIWKVGFSYTDYAPDIKLNESGVWFLETFFEISNATHNNYTIISIWRYIGEENEPKNDSPIIHFANATYGSYFSLTWGIPVYTLNEYAQIRNARASEEAVTQQAKTAKANEELASMQRITIVVTAIMAIATGLMAFFTYRDTREIHKERRRESIIKMVVVIKGAIEEFRDIEGSLGIIINQQKFVELPQLKYLNALKIEYWQDFKRFYRTEFEKIKQCKDKINTYTKKRKDCKQEIMEILKEKWKKNELEDIKKYIKKLIEEGNWTTGVNGVFNGEVSTLAENILLKGKEGSNVADKIYKRFEEKLNGIRNKEIINGKITQLSSLAKEIQNCISIRQCLEKIKADLEHKYDILEGELKEKAKVIKEEIEEIFESSSKVY